MAACSASVGVWICFVYVSDVFPIFIVCSYIDYLDFSYPVSLYASRKPKDLYPAGCSTSMTYHL